MTAPLVPIHIDTFHKNNTVRTVAVFVGIAAGIASIIYLINQIRLTRLQLDKFQKDEERRDTQMEAHAKQAAQGLKWREAA